MGQRKQCGSPELTSGRMVGYEKADILYEFPKAA